MSLEKRAGMYAFHLSQAERRASVQLGPGRHGVGGGEGDALRIEGLPPAALQLEIAQDAVFVVARVGGIRLGEWTLQPGARWLWRPAARLRACSAEVALEPPPRPPEATGVLAGALLGFGGSEALPCLVWLNGPDCGRRLPLLEPATELGRAAFAGARVRDALASRRHARLELGPGPARLVDLASRNGLFVDGARVTGARRLRGGEALRLGETCLAYEPGAPPSGQAAAKVRPPRTWTGVFEIAALAGAALAGALGTGAMWYLAR